MSAERKTAARNTYPLLSSRLCRKKKHYLLLKKRIKLLRQKLMRTRRKPKSLPKSRQKSKA